MTKTTATISQHSERAGDWLYIYGSRTIPIRSIIPEWASLPGYDQPKLVYMAYQLCLVQIMIEKVERSDKQVSTWSLRQRLTVLRAAAWWITD